MERSAIDGRGGYWRPILWAAAASLLLVPAVAMRFTTEVNWTALDFVFAGGQIAAVGFAIEFLVGRSTNTAYRIGSVLAVLAAFLTIWVNSAVGMIGSEDNRYNLMFLGVIAIGAAGAAAAHFRPSGMAKAMVVAGLAQAILAGIGLSADARGAAFSIAFALPWLLSAACFGRSASR